MIREDMQDRKVIVTGGGSGIGAACARALGAAGCRVLVADAAGDAAMAVAAEIVAAGGVAVGIAADVTDAARVDAMVGLALESFGGLDGAVNNAGIAMDPRATADVAEADWLRVVDVNLSGVWRCMAAEIRAMLPARRGAIVNVSSVLGMVGAAGLAPYVASKHGVIGLTRAAALDYARKGLRINAICPGYIDTPMIHAGEGWAEREAYLTRLHPMARLGRDAEVVELILFLLSDRSGFMTGGVHAVDGGYTAW
ncbi:MAG: SDR family oxidoreductase [Rhodocyclaceae bacterium]|nr:SDR family oxidoreductase [Rhodocyclaceae bacterium]